VIIRLVCIKRFKGFKYRSSDNRGRSGQNGFRVWGGAQVWRRQGSMEFGWRRGSMREERNQNKENTKGGNDKTGMVQGRSEVLDKGRR